MASSPEDQSYGEQAARDLTTAAVRAHYYEQAQQGTLELGVLTDEELLGLDDPELEAPPFPSPYLASLGAAERDTAVTAALRSLTARGVYRATPLGEAEDSVEIWMEPDLAALMSMRRGTLLIIVAERDTSHGKDWVVLHAQPHGLWLEEVIEHHGLHHFALISHDQAAVDLHVRALAGLEPTVEGPAIDLVVPRRDLAENPSALAPVADARAMTQVTRLDISEDATLTTSGLTVLASPDFLVLGRADDEAMHYRSTTSDALHDDLRDLLRGKPSA